MMTNFESIRALADLLKKYPGAAVLSGAGISTESGIPDFRSPGTGIYAKIDPMEYLSVNALTLRPKEFWKYFSLAFGAVNSALPNSGHLALARLEESGWIGAVITQNIDGLHQKAGSKNVIEIHGHLRTVHCMGCRHSYEMRVALEQLEHRETPRCDACSGGLRPDVVLFGDCLTAYDAASQAVQRGRMLLVTGSSLSVSPANMLVYDAEKLAIVNLEPTGSDGQAEITIQGRTGEVLNALAREILR